MSDITEKATLPPEVSPRAKRVALWFARPVERFLHVEASSGIILLVAAAIALIWANSPWSESYHHLLDAQLSIGFDDHRLTQTLHFWINEILMVLFFFVVGLEIRGEIHNGSLSSMSAAGLPVAAALGGIAVPATLYSAFNAGEPGIGGWGVPMATDIAFAVGVLALLGNRVPASLRILLLAVAIIDDICAILVIAIFYSSGVNVLGFALAGLGVVIVIAMQRIGLRNAFLYMAPGAVMWTGLLIAGVHPTIAGVLLGLLTPARSWFGERAIDEIQSAVVELRQQQGNDARALIPALDRIALARQEALSPATRLETALHSWSAFGVMPIFALANAGVALDDVSFDAPGATLVTVGIVVGLVLGKPIGIISASWLLVRSGWGSLPKDVSWSGLSVVGCVAGIGFTMALFIGSLAFSDPAMLAVAKLGVLIASLAAGVLALIVGARVLPKPQA